MSLNMCGLHSTFIYVLHDHPKLQNLIWGQICRTDLTAYQQMMKYVANKVKLWLYWIIAKYIFEFTTL